MYSLIWTFPVWSVDLNNNLYIHVYYDFDNGSFEIYSRDTVSSTDKLLECHSESFLPRFTLMAGKIVGNMLGIELFHNDSITVFLVNILDDMYLMVSPNNPQNSEIKTNGVFVNKLEIQGKVYMITKCTFSVAEMLLGDESFRKAISRYFCFDCVDAAYSVTNLSTGSECFI